MHELFESCPPRSYYDFFLPLPNIPQYKDFLKIGTPMQLILWLLTVASLSQGGSNVPWYLSWIITTLVLVVVALGKMVNKEGNLLNSAIVALQQMLKRGATLLDFVVVAIRNTLNRGGNLVNRWKESPREERNDN